MDDSGFVSLSSRVPTATEMSQIKLVTDFCITKDYKIAQSLFRSDTILVLNGLSGSGKSEIAKQLIADQTRASDGCLKPEIIDSSSLEKINNRAREILSVYSPNPSDDISIDSLLTFMDRQPGSCLIFDDFCNLEKNFLQKLARFKNMKFVITTQEDYDDQKHPDGWKSLAKHHKVSGFTKEEAERFLDAGSINFALFEKYITNLPVVWRVLKGAWQSNELLDKDNFLERFISEVKGLEKEEAIGGILAAINQAFVDKPEYMIVLRHLGMYEHKDITVDMLIALVEELDHKKTLDDANELVVRLRTRSLCTKTESNGEVLYTLHKMVHLAIISMIRPEEKKETLRIAMQAFARIMPKDGRNHQYEILPRLLEHAIKLHENCNSIMEDKESPFIQMLHAELYTSIGYCMLAHKYDVELIIKRLLDGKKIFETKLYRAPGSNISIRLVTGENYYDMLTTAQYLQNDVDYQNYTTSLQFLHRLTERDFNCLFPHDEWKKYHPKLKNGHLTEASLQILLPTDKLSLETLRGIYPLELFTALLHMLSKAYFHKHARHVNGNAADRYTEALQCAKLADDIYKVVETRNDVKLMGWLTHGRFYQSRRLNQSMQPRDLDTLRKWWQDLKVDCSSTYECGIVRIRDISGDEFNQLLCMEHELEVIGKIIGIDNSRRVELQRNAENLIRDIEHLAGKHKKPALTLSKSYEKFANFWLSVSDFEKAVEKTIDSMMKYRENCAGKNFSSMKEGEHPELEKDKRGKFDPLYELLGTCIDKLFRKMPSHTPPKDSRYQYLKSIKETGKLANVDVVHVYITMADYMPVGSEATQVD